MGSQRRNKTKIDNNHHEETEGRRNLNSIPLELLVDIFLRLPLRYIARLITVSKFFATIIRSQYFITTLALRSSKQKQRILLAFSKMDQEKGETWFFFSTSLTLKEESSSSSSSLVFLSSTTACPIPLSRYTRPDYVHGLISILYGQEHIICNPNTGKFITLPSIDYTKRVVKRFFGYDPVDGQYKVLCVAKPINGTNRGVAPNGYQVITLGSSSRDQNSWRNIECSSPHSPQSKSICINGVLYYCACMGTSMTTTRLVRFDVRSEDFDFVIKFRPEVEYQVRNGRIQYLINYEGNVALVTSDGLYACDLWILKDAKGQEWSKVSLSLHQYRPSDIRGTTQTGEIIYAPNFVHDHGFHLVRHDHKMKDIKKVGIDEDPNYEFGQFFSVVSYMDYVESLMFS